MMDSVYGGMSIHFLQGAEEEMSSLMFHSSLTPVHSAVHVRSSVPGAHQVISGVAPAKRGAV